MNTGQPPPLPSPCRHRKFWIVIWVLGVGLGLSLLLNMSVGASLFLQGHGAQTGRQGEDECPALTEIWSAGAGDVKVARIALTGLIARESEGGWFGGATDPVEAVLRQIRVAGNDPEVRAILLEVDSPGGGVTPTDEIHHALTAFKAGGEDRRVVVLVKDMAASGGYYVALAADWIVAEPTAIIGSIGIILQTLNWKALSDKIGIQDVTLKSGKNKDLLNPFREVQPEQLGLLQELLDAMYRRFCDLVREGRSLDPETVARLADGRLFTADAALHAKLIDAVGYWDDAVRKTEALVQAESVKIVRYEDRPSLARLFAQLRAPPALPTWLHQATDTPRLMYLWRP